MSDYVNELRQLIGHRPLILAGAGVLIFNARRQVLPQLRTDNQLWGIPGGSMEPGEYFEETARREVQEECGLTLGKLPLLDVFSGPDQFYQFLNGDQL